MNTDDQTLLLKVADAIAGEINRQSWNGDLTTDCLEVARAALEAAGHGRVTIGPYAPEVVRFDGGALDPEAPWTVDLLDEEGRVACSAQVRPGEDAVFPPFEGNTVTGIRYTSPVLPLAPTTTALDLKP